MTRQSTGRIYLDDAAFAPVLPAVVAAVREAPEANPSSPHGEGRAARGHLDQSRDLVAHALGANRTEITFTSSGTEAVNLALLGAAARLPASGTLVTWAAEHQSVLGALRRLEAAGRRVRILPVDGQGRADPDGIPDGASLVSISVANNEVGTVQPAVEIIARAKSLGALVHLDACCGPRWMEIPRGADLISISGYKLGAGHGGLLYVRDGVRIDPLQLGGPQEWGRRAGQEDVAAARAVAVAIDESARTRSEKSAAARPLANELRAALSSLGAKITGSDDRLPNFASCAFADRKGEDLVMALDLEGVAVSSGSACASGSLDPSHVLLAMGLTLEEALGSLRLTVGYDTTRDDIERALDILSTTLARRPARA